MQRNTPTPIRNTPSSAPLEAMVSKQQTHIDDLVTKNRALEQNLSKLQSELVAEKTRYEDGLHSVRLQYDTELRQWKEQQEMQSSLWRISYMRLVVKIEAERKAVLDVQDELRLARLAIVQRDYQLEMFSHKEGEQEDRIAELEQELDDVRFELEEAQPHSFALEKQVSQLSNQMEREAQKLLDAIEENDQLERTLQGLRKEHATLLSSSSTSSSSLERVKLELDGVQASFAELRTKYDELERERADLVRQLEKWRTMENRDGEELGTLRKRTVELEVEVANLHEAEEQREKKFTAKLRKYKDSLAEHVEAYNQSEAECDVLKSEVAQLQAQLEERGVEIDRIRESSGQPEAITVINLKNKLAEKDRLINQLQARLDNTQVLDTRPNASDDEEAGMPGSSSKHVQDTTKPKPRPKIRAKPSAADTSRNDDEGEPVQPDQALSQERPKPRPRQRIKAPQPVQDASDDDDEIQEIEPPPNVVFSSGKKKQQARGQSKEPNASSEIEVRELPPESPSQSRPARGKAAGAKTGTGRKKKETKNQNIDTDTDDHPVRGSRTGKTKVSVEDEGPSSSHKGKRRAVDLEAEEEHQETPSRPSKKRRSGKKKDADEEEHERPVKANKGKEKAKAKAKDKGKKVPLFLRSSDSEGSEKDKAPGKKKAKRKIGLGLGSTLGIQSPPKLIFNLNGDQRDKGLNVEVPTELESPTKDLALPPRTVSALGKSISTKVGSFVGRS